MIEVLANLKGNPNLFPDTFQLSKISVTKDVSIEALAPDALADDRRSSLLRTRALGDDWLLRRSSALLRVPSVPSPESFNYLLNPQHVLATGVQIEWCKLIEWDKRLFHVRGPA